MSIIKTKSSTAIFQGSRMNVGAMFWDVDLLRPNHARTDSAFTDTTGYTTVASAQRAEKIETDPAEMEMDDQKGLAQYVYWKIWYRSDVVENWIVQITESGIKYGVVGKQEIGHREGLLLKTLIIA